MHKTVRAFWLIGVVVGLAAAGIAAPASQKPASFTVGTLTVHRHGDRGRPLILIPGLASGAWVWKGSVARFAPNHVIYAVTLAGFDGIAPPKDGKNLIAQADASLLELIRERRIVKPVLIGHSLGATLALKFATEHSDLLGGVIALDGLPVFPGTEDMSAEQRAAFAQGLKARMAQMTPAQYQAQELAFMQRIGLIDPKTAAKYAALTGKSDQAAVAEYMAEDFELDFRPQLKNIGVPVLEISPYYAPDFGKASRLPMSEQQKADYYKMLLAGTPKLQVVSISPARHFAMLDQPQKFYAIVAKFLGALPAPAH